MEEDEEERGFITAKDFMNDFATEEFLNKNIRVRPQSGVQREVDGESKVGGTDFVSRNILAGAAADQTEEEEKSNNMINIEMEEQRKQIKAIVSFITLILQKEENYKKKLLEEERKKKKH